jgi:hypothetical protein
MPVCGAITRLLSCFRMSLSNRALLLFETQFVLDDCVIHPSTHRPSKNASIAKFMIMSSPLASPWSFAGRVFKFLNHELCPPLLTHSQVARHATSSSSSLMGHTSS